MKMVAMEHDDPNSVLIEPGSTQELIWTFNDSAGLQFACNVPGITNREWSANLI